MCRELLWLSVLLLELLRAALSTHSELETKTSPEQHRGVVLGQKEEQTHQLSPSEALLLMVTRCMPPTLFAQWKRSSGASRLHYACAPPPFYYPYVE